MTAATFPFVVVGHVDHGKSTLIGRLLADTDSLPEGRLEKVQKICQEQRKAFEYAFLLDALEAEQLQGVTIDITEVRFHWRDRTYVIIDAPGHKEFLKNMITGAAHAEAALLLIDASEGVQEQTCRHAYLLSFLGVRNVAVVVSKMDLVGYDEARFEAIRAEYGRFLATLGVTPVAFVPISARDGENIVNPSARMPWHTGPSVLTVLEGFVPAERRSATQALRLAVQDVYKFDSRRIVAGRIESGRIAVGDEVEVWPSGHRAHVKSIEAWPEPDQPAREASAGMSVGITLDYQLFVQRGDVIADPTHPPTVSSFLAGNVFWIGRTPLEPTRRYKLKLATLERDVDVASIPRVLSAVSLEVQNRSEIGTNEAGEVVFRSARPFVFDLASELPATGRFVVLDGYDVVGGGIVVEADETYRRRYRLGLPKSEGIAPVRGGVSAAERAAAYGHKGHVIWLTGMPGTGKSTIARELERELFRRDIKTFVLDGENLRFGLSADLDFTDAARTEQSRRVAEVAALFCTAGLTVIVALISPFHTVREHARDLVGDEHFTLVHLHAPMAHLQARDPHGLYARALKDPGVRVPGVNAVYEIPVAPVLAFDTSTAPSDTIVNQVLQRVLSAVC
jgi:bifunctional enzyme CysN/CysC